MKYAPGVHLSLWEMDTGSIYHLLIILKKVRGGGPYSMGWGHFSLWKMDPGVHLPWGSIFHLTPAMVSGNGRSTKSRDPTTSKCSRNCLRCDIRSWNSFMTICKTVYAGEKVSRTILSRQWTNYVDVDIVETYIRGSQHRKWCNCMSLYFKLCGTVGKI